ncbi:family 20 glycosylhydrolase, partial [Escherichia coli]|nr:family 20 glycosylhydrolase [Escherichia coli]
VDSQNADSLPQLSIQDAPRFDYRGVMVDVARNFHSKDAILATLDQMAAYKMNKLHLHLTDDEGWRLEIPGLPELTEVGSNRCFDLEEKSCL